MKLRGSSYFLILIMVIMLVAIIAALRMEYFASKLLPVLVGSLVFILATIELGRELLTRHGSTAIVTDMGAETKAPPRKYVLTGGWIVGFFLAIYLLGFLVAIPLFVLFYSKSHGTRWLVAIILAILMTAVASAFQFFLMVDLYQGLLLTWLGY